MDWSQIIGIIIGAIVTLGLAYIRGYFEKKATDKKIDKKEEVQNENLQKAVKLITDEIKGLSSSVVNLELELMNHIEITNFISDLRASIQNRSKQILYLSLTLNQKYKNILGYWSEIIEKFAVNFCDNKNRKKDTSILEKQLLQDMRKELEDFNYYMDDLIDEYRVVKNKKYCFSKYLNEFQVHNKTHLLVARLIENGFKKEDNDKLIKVFTKYIEEYFQVFLTAITAWNELEIYNFNEENTM
jgi:hypothetical protein